jgi:hypothetical protein
MISAAAITIEEQELPNPARDLSITSHLICTTCSYDLRGLPSSGRCPECGTHIAHTLLGIIDLAGIATARSPIPAASLIGLRDGAAMLLVGSLVMFAFPFVPGSWFDFRTTQRAIMLGVACIAWVLSCYGIFKLGLRLPPNALRHHDRLARRGLRLIAVFLMFSPALGALLLDWKHPLALDIPVLAHAFVPALGFSLIVIGPLLFLRVHRLLAALEMPTLAAATALLACFWPLTVDMLVYRSLDRDPFNSLEFLMTCPLPLAGASLFWRELIRYGWQVSAREMMIFLPSIVSAASAVVVLALLVRVILELRVRSREPEGFDERIAASSPP